MTVEVVNVIGDFDVTLPADGDFLNEGDDHIRNVKKGVLGSFTGTMNTPITTNDTQFNYLNNSTSSIQDQLDALVSALSLVGSVPIGGIIDYNGAFSAIPANFQLCDGTNGTPNLTDQFIYTTNTEIELGQTGGTADSVNISHNHTFAGTTLPVHNHTTSILNPAGSANGGPLSLDNRIDTIDGASTSVSAGTPSGSISTDGANGTGLNIPPFYRLAKIRRMS